MNRFKDKFSYGLFSVTEGSKNLYLRSYSEYIDEVTLKKHIANVPQFSVDVLDDYRNFFRTIGSHVITAVSYGLRLVLVRQ